MDTAHLCSIIVACCLEEGKTEIGGLGKVARKTSKLNKSAVGGQIFVYLLAIGGD